MKKNSCPGISGTGYGRDGEENSTDRERGRERIVGGRFLREVFGTGLGVLCEKHSVAPAITVGEDGHLCAN